MSQLSHAWHAFSEHPHHTTLYMMNSSSPFFLCTCSFAIHGIFSCGMRSMRYLRHLCDTCDNFDLKSCRLLVKLSFEQLQILTVVHCQLRGLMLLTSASTISRKSLSISSRPLRICLWLPASRVRVPHGLPLSSYNCTKRTIPRS